MIGANWTTFEGQPVYWLAPEFWNPKTGIVNLVLPGEDAARLDVATSIQRSVEFLKLQGDTRYCTPEQRLRMKTLMRERLGTDQPWRNLNPVNEHPAPEEVTEADGFPQPEIPF